MGSDYVSTKCDIMYSKMWHTHKHNEHIFDIKYSLMWHKVLRDVTYSTHRYDIKDPQMWHKVLRDITCNRDITQRYDMVTQCQRILRDVTQCTHKCNTMYSEMSHNVLRYVVKLTLTLSLSVGVDNCGFERAHCLGLISSVVHKIWNFDEFCYLPYTINVR